MSDRIEVSAADLAAALENFRLDVRAGGVYGVHGSPLATVNGTIDKPQLVADVLFGELTANATHREPDEPERSPGYYDGETGMQPFDVIDEFNLDFYEGNVIKYLVRWRKKNGLEDLRKARTYLSRIIARAEREAAASG